MKTFKKATYVKRDSTFGLKCPSVMKQKVIKKEKKTARDDTTGSGVFTDEELLILQSFLPTSCGAETPSASDGVLTPPFSHEISEGSRDMECVFTDSLEDGSSMGLMLAVPDITDVDIEPYLDSQELFINFNLFA